MAKAHLVIGRAGASTVAELTVMGRPAILVPLPHAIDNDQLDNATRLAESGGAWCIEQKELTPERLRAPAPSARRAGHAGGRLPPPSARAGRCGRRGSPISSRSWWRRAPKDGKASSGTWPEETIRKCPAPVHILGIGGIGMSAIAEILHAKGYTVQGSDQKDSANVRRLRAKGIRCSVGHDPINLVGATSSSSRRPSSRAIPSSRPRAERGLPIIRRAEMLAELMRLYAHRLRHRHARQDHHHLAHRPHLQRAGLDPTVITGGIINDWGSNAPLGNGKWMIVEADESDGTFIKMPTADRRRHQHRPGAPRLLRRSRTCIASSRPSSQHPVLRPRRRLHRPSRGAELRAAGGAARRRR